MDARGDPAGLNTLETGEGSGAAGGDNPQSLVDPPAARRAGGPPPTLTNPVGLTQTSYGRGVPVRLLWLW